MGTGLAGRVHDQRHLTETRKRDVTRNPYLNGDKQEKDVVFPLRIMTHKDQLCMLELAKLCEGDHKAEAISIHLLQHTHILILQHLVLC